MKCSNCGAELAENQVFCSECGTKVEETKLPEVTFSVKPVAIEKETGKMSNGGLFFSAGGIISGILSIIFGIIVLVKDVGDYEFSSSYGGDAYTGIQNAAAQTANNVQALSEIAKNGFGFLLVAIGLIAIFYFVSKLKK